MTGTFSSRHKAKFYVFEENNLISSTEIYHVTVAFSPEKKKIIHLSKIEHLVTIQVFTVLFQGSLGNKSRNTFPSSFGQWGQKAVEPGRHSCCHRPQLIGGSVSRATTCMVWPGALWSPTITVSDLTNAVILTGALFVFRKSSLFFSEGVQLLFAALTL